MSILIKVILWVLALRLLYPNFEGSQRNNKMEPKNHRIKEAHAAYEKDVVFVFDGKYESWSSYQIANRVMMNLQLLCSAEFRIVSSQSPKQITVVEIQSQAIDVLIVSKDFC